MNRCAAPGVLAIGPGLGTSDWAQRLWAAALSAGVPTIADADALNLLALNPAKLPAGWVITPHPGEAARLLGTVPAAVQADRVGAVRELHSRYGAVCVLKGAGTLVAWGAAGATEIAICERGNPGMATAGMGDVLTGVIAGLRAQSGDSAQVARVGVWCTRWRGFGGTRRAARSSCERRHRGIARWVNP
jgi:hydroxyethylthiazole kinase-like uncharacterized protein yjeF